MLFDQFSHLNWLAVLVATFAFGAIGGIVYSQPVLGKAWMKAIGNTPGAGSPSAGLIVSTLTAYFVQATALGLILRAAGATTVGDAVVVGVVIGTGILGIGAWVATLYEKRPASLAVINGLNATLGFVAMSVILALWD